MSRSSPARSTQTRRLGCVLQDATKRHLPCRLCCRPVGMLAFTQVLFVSTPHACTQNVSCLHNIQPSQCSFLLMCFCCLAERRWRLHLGWDSHVGHLQHLLQFRYLGESKCFTLPIGPFPGNFPHMGKYPRLTIFSNMAVGKLLVNERGVMWAGSTQAHSSKCSSLTSRLTPCQIRKTC